MFIVMELGLMNTDVAWVEEMCWLYRKVARIVINKVEFPLAHDKIYLSPFCSLPFLQSYCITNTFNPSDQFAPIEPNAERATTVLEMSQ